MRTARRVVCVPHAEPFWRDSTQECAEHSNSFNPTQRRLDRSTAAHPSLAPAIVSWASPKATVSPTAVCDETTSGLVHYDHSHIPHRQQPRLAQPPPALAAGGEQALPYGSAATMGAVYIVVATFPTRLRCITPPPWIRTALQRLATLRDKIIPLELAMRSDTCPIAGEPWRSTTARSSRLAIEAARVWVQGGSGVFWAGLRWPSPQKHHHRDRNSPSSAHHACPEASWAANPLMISGSLGRRECAGRCPVRARVQCELRSIVRIRTTGCLSPSAPPASSFVHW
jgi:hypothetical protein